MVKRILTCLLALAMAFQMTACAAGAKTPAFADVPSGAGYAQAVAWCAENGLMNGVDDGTNFDPDGSITRAMLATILYRQAGEPNVNGAPTFTDAQPNVWYSNAVAWASERQLMQGYGDGLFGVNDPVSKEMLNMVIARQNGEDPAWTGNAELAADATRAEAAVALYETFREQTPTAPTAPEGEKAPGDDPSSTPEEANQMYVQIGDTVWTATLEDNPSVTAWKELLAKGPVSVDMHDYGSFEKVGGIGTTLTRSDRQITTKPGDIILYQGSSITIYYDENSWNFTPLGHLDHVSDAELRRVLKAGGEDIQVTFSLKEPAGSSTASVFDIASKSVTLNSGYSMPINGLGTYSLHGDECVNAVKSAIEQGVRLIDTARIYGNEEEIGRAVREEIAAGTVTREELFVTTKIYPGSDMENPEEAIQGCLDRLDIGYVDMMLLHHPDPNDVKAYKAMEEFAADGKIRSIGLSNWYVEELEEFLPQVDTVPALVQNEIHPYYQENNVIPFIQEKGIVVQGWYPLGGRGHTAELLGDETITAIAKAHNVSSAQVILRWNLQKGVVVIPGSSNPEHIKENTELYHFELTEDEMAQVNALDRNEKHDWY